MGLPVTTLNPQREMKILKHLLEHGNGTGPLVYGRDHPQCRDCSACICQLWECHHNTQLEVIAVEFARDFEILSDLFNTTQENVVEYVRRSEHQPDYIVFNTGLHDLLGSVELYTEALAWYTDLMRTHLPRTQLIWLTTTAINEPLVPEEYKNRTTDANARRFNAAASKVMADRHIPTVDAYRISALGRQLGWYQDGVHARLAPESPYYELVMLLISEQICKMNQGRS